MKLLKKLFERAKFTKWKPIYYCWPYPEGYGIYRKNRFTGVKTVLDRFDTKAEALEQCKIMNQ